MLRFHTLDVFTRQAFGGNPLAVVLGGDGLDAAQMQRVAREFQLSETVFVLAATQPGTMSRLRIFTPFEELPFAGHPVVGAACALAMIGVLPRGCETHIALETGIGTVPVCVRHGQDPPYAELTAARPDFAGIAPSDEDIGASLGLGSGDIGYGTERPRVASCGLPTLLVPLRAPEYLAGILPDPSRLAAILAGIGARNLYAYARGYEGELRARMFMPGIGEDPATGSAAAALAGRLADECALPDGRLDWKIVQGLEIGRRSELFVSAERADGRVDAVRVGGHAVRIMEGVLHAA